MTAIKIEDILAGSATLTEGAKAALQEAWNAKLSDAKESLRLELREEFAQKFEHDKKTLVEAMDKYLEDAVSKEMEEFAEDKKNLVAERVKYKENVKKHTALLDKFMTETLAKEVKELRQDKAKMTHSVSKLENFVLKQLAEEIREFRTDKKALVEQKVRMVAEGKQVLANTKASFVKKAAKIVEENIEKLVRNEIKQYKDDIVAARENDFGRRLFEAFAAEYMTSYLNEGSDIKKLQTVLSAKDKEIESARKETDEQKKLTESVLAKVNALQDQLTREKTMNELLAPLSKEKKEVMSDLLSTVKTNSLKESYQKYLPAVLNEKVVPTHKQVIREAVVTEKTGNRTNINSQSEESDLAIDLQAMKKLAGLNK